MQEGGNRKRRDVFDVGQKTSVKNAERCSRGSAISPQWKYISQGRGAAQMDRQQNNRDNVLHSVEVKLQDKQLVSTCGETCSPHHSEMLLGS